MARKPIPSLKDALTMLRKDRRVLSDLERIGSSDFMINVSVTVYRGEVEKYYALVSYYQSLPSSRHVVGWLYNATVVPTLDHVSELNKEVRYLQRRVDRMSKRT